MKVILEKLKFFFQTLYSNMVIAHNEQKWYFAIIFFAISMVISVSGTLSTTLSSNVNNLFANTSESAIDNSLYQFASSFTDGKNKITITDGTLKGEGIYQGITLTNDAINSSTPINANFTATHSYPNNNATEDITILQVFVFDQLEPNYKKEDTDLLNSFLRTSVYLYSKESGESSETPKWSAHSFIIFTKNSVHISIYKIGGDSTSSIGSMAGNFTNFQGTYSIGDNLLADGKVDLDNYTNNFKAFANKAYDTIKVPSAWSQTGIYFAVNIGITFLSGLIFWLLVRKKELDGGLKFTFWKGQKLAYFESLTPSILASISSVFVAQYSTFIFLIVLAIRISSTMSKLSNPNRGNTNEAPVYKARS